jgi:hypothetical protein
VLHHDVLPLLLASMAGVVLRVRLTSGDHIDVAYDEPDTISTDEVIEHAISSLAEDSGVLRTKHGGRLVALFGRGVAALEVAPQGPIL